MMDKNREVRRGGVVGKRHISATCRSRASSVFKYSSVNTEVSNEDGDDILENDLSPILSKKHLGRTSLSLKESDSCKDADRSRNKRKRPGLQEPQNHQSACSAAAAKEVDDNSDDTQMGRSEDDDDLPPSTVRRRPWKQKLHGKSLEDLSPIDPAAVPRKLRTAMTKRQQESTPADIPKQHISSDAAIMSAPARSNVAVNPGHKKKPDNQKPPTFKVAKIYSAKVSKTEAEVAETLFDLARMFTSQTVPSPPEAKAEPTLPAKSGSATTGTGPDMKRSPGALTNDAASSSSSLTQSQPGVLKKKRPLMSLKTKDEGLTSVTGRSSEPAPAEQSLSIHSDKSQSQMESRMSRSAGTVVAQVLGSLAASPNVKADLENPVALEAKAPRLEASSPSMEIRSTSHLSGNVTISNSGGPVNAANKDNEFADNLVKRETVLKLGLENRTLESAPKDGDPVNKFEIDLMAPPQGIDNADEVLDSNMPDAKQKEQTFLNDHKDDGNLDSNMTNAQEKDEVDLTIPTAEIASVDKERKKVEISENMEFNKQNKQPIESSKNDLCSDWTPEKNNVLIRERNNKTDALKDKGKQEVVKQPLKGTVNYVKPETGPQKIDRSDPNALAKVTTKSNLKGTPLPVSVAGWPVGFPNLGYYSPVAAAAAASWLNRLSMTGMSSSENSRVTPQLPSFFFLQQQSRNRCATHVYITHFIDAHQQIKSNPLWAVAHGNPTALYGNGIMGVPVSTALEPGPVACLNEKEPNGPAPAAANVPGAKEKVVDSGLGTVEIKSCSEKQTHSGQKNPSISVQNDHVFGLPVTISAASSVTGSGTGTANTPGRNILVTAAMFSGGNSASTCSSSVNNTGNGLLDGSVATAAVLEAQLLNSVIQQPTFPFSISTDHFGSAYSGHLVPQQVPQIFSNPFYDTHMVSQQLANDTIPSAPQKQPKNSQGSCPSSGSYQLQHQETLMPTQATLSASEAALQQSKLLNEKNIMLDSRSARKQSPTVQRNLYSLNFPSVQVTSLSSQPAAIGGCMPALPVLSQDFSLTTNFGGKQIGKTKQQAQTQVQKQQNASLATEYHAAAPALQTELKELDSKVSQSSLSRGHMTPNLVGLSGVTSIMTPQGELLQSMVDITRGHGQPQKLIQNQTTSGQSHQYSMPGSHDQKIHRRQHLLMERAGATNAAVSGRTTNEGIYGKVGHDENQKEFIKYEVDQPHVFRIEWGESAQNMRGSQPNTDPKRVSNVNSTVITFAEGTASQATMIGKFPTGHFPWHNASLSSQGLKRSHAAQDPAQLKTTTVVSAGTMLATTSGTPPQGMQGAMSKSQGQQLRSEQSMMNLGSISRVSPAPSIASSASATSPHQSVSKSGVGAPTENSVSIKDPHSSVQKPPIDSTLVKGMPAANMTSVLRPGSATLQAQLNQNHYSIQQQQHHQDLRQQQTLQYLDSSQKHYGQAVLQNFPLNQNYSHQTNKHPSSQKQRGQFGQRILFHQPLQYEVGTRSQVHSQPTSQQATLHHQQTLQQLQQPPRQTAALPQQHGSIQQQHLKHLQPVLPTTFGVSVSGTLPHGIGTVDAGNSSLSIASDGVTNTAQSTTEINIPCSSSKTSCNDGPVLPHAHNGTVSSLQHANSSNAVSGPYPNEISQPMPNSGAVEKLNDKTNQ